MSCCFTQLKRGQLVLRGMQMFPGASGTCPALHFGDPLPQGRAQTPLSLPHHTGVPENNEIFQVKHHLQ